MSTEHLTPAAEHHERANAELEALGKEQLDKARETAAEHDPAHAAEKAKERAEIARNVIENQAEPEPANASEDETKPTPGLLPFLDHHLNYTQTLASVQRRLTPISRSFSKVIHNSAVEKTSEALENTVARPSVLLGTTWTALIVGTIFYLTAHHYGYALSGSELLFSFVVGALLGLVIEGLWRLLKRR